MLKTSQQLANRSPRITNTHSLKVVCRILPQSRIHALQNSKLGIFPSEPPQMMPLYQNSDPDINTFILTPKMQQLNFGSKLAL